MISVSEAEKIILSQVKDYGTEYVPFLAAQGRVLAENILADRDFPPYDRVTMDGIAIRFSDYQAGCRSFRIAAIQAAGDEPFSAWPVFEGLESIEAPCLEIMTGAACAPIIDTIIPYEKLKITNGVAELIPEPVTRGQNIHRQGSDRQKGEAVILSGQVIGPVEINVAASVGKFEILVKKLPKVVILSSGDELVDVFTTPLPYQIRRSNNYSIYATLKQFGIEAVMLHLPDDEAFIKQEMIRCQLEFDVVLLSGGVSMGKFDYIPAALEASGVKMHFHKVKQRPGKPFWFGTFGECGVVFALPGNPVSTFLCLHRYVLPWLKTSLGFPKQSQEFALLKTPFRFEAAMVYFLQVKLTRDKEARLWAEPAAGHGSGDFANLLETDAFLELPADRTEFLAGELLPFIRFRKEV